MDRQRRQSEPFDVLLVEDNPGDIRLVREAFAETETETRVHELTTGQRAIDFVAERAASDVDSTPDLALVDLNLPGKDGCAVLEAIRDDPQLRRLPVVILTSSDSREDVARCYDAYANSYLTKPRDAEAFIELIQTVARFWFEQAQLPPISA